jgi:hypothetical protein
MGTFLFGTGASCILELRGAAFFNADAVALIRRALQEDANG